MKSRFSTAECQVNRPYFLVHVCMFLFFVFHVCLLSRIFGGIKRAAVSNRLTGAAVLSDGTLFRLQG